MADTGPLGAAMGMTIGGLRLSVTIHDLLVHIAVARDRQCDLTETIGDMTATNTVRRGAEVTQVIRIVDVGTIGAETGFATGLDPTSLTTIDATEMMVINGDM